MRRDIFVEQCIMGELCVQYEKQVLCLYLRSIYGVYQQLLTIIDSFFSSRGNFSLYFNDTRLDFRHYPRFELSLFSDLACFPCALPLYTSCNPISPFVTLLASYHFYIYFIQQVFLVFSLGTMMIFRHSGLRRNEQNQICLALVQPPFLLLKVVHKVLLCRCTK